MTERASEASALGAGPGTAAPRVPQPSVVARDDFHVSAALPTGEQVHVLLYGAHVTSWKDRHGSEKLWLSEASKLDGSAPVRGGIPLVFPVFTTSPEHAQGGRLPHHGLARISRWEFLGESTCLDGQDQSVSLDFSLGSLGVDEKLRALWPFDFKLVYSVTLRQSSLSTSLSVMNTGSEPFECKILLHTYLRVQDITKVQIAGLDGTEYVDTVDAGKRKYTSGNVVVLGETGNIYTVDESQPVSVTRDEETLYTIHRANLGEVVLWNPWSDKASKMDDFEPKDGYKNMLCIEPGVVNTWQVLEPGAILKGAQTIVT